jgi:HAD superfamily hydrolase (TIGR01549 family)
MTESRATRTAVLFDLDGTLINTRRLYFEAYRRALLTNLGRELSERDFSAVTRPTERGIFESTLPAADVVECMTRFYEHYSELHATHYEGFYAGVADLLEELRKRGVALGIVTNKSRRTWDITSAAAELGPFDVVIVADDVTEAKPDPEGLRLALSAMKRTPAEALYVGDAVHDLRAARAAGLLGVAALWSRTGARYESLKAAALELGAAVAETPHDVLQLI